MQIMPRHLHPLYNVWKAMKTRCYKPTKKQYKDYGGRGIKVCDEWLHNFDQFVADMGERPQGYLLERKDNNKNYCKNNCKWASRKEQQRNQRRTVYVNIEDKQFKAIELAEKYGIKCDTIIARSKKGLTFSEIIFKGRLPDTIPAWIRKEVGRKNSITRKSKPTCKRGHPFDEQNTRIAKNGQRICRACRRLINY